ncbi:histidine phosphatase family protein [Fodinicola acaciae]|uniref:histidine phosphatase family protein n=1 Tax=Fodinicola acaciae TaxID=2681555 RepID=UPI0013D277CF|nr:histidine phosphatase family protein [Fodinicola acaciae]
MTKTVVHLLRHGEVYNPAKILYGRLPGYRLSGLGEQMAEVVARTLADHDITYIAASPLERAQQTAMPLAALLGLEVHTDDRLIESLNYFEGRSVSPGDGALANPRYWYRLRNPFTPSWGEPYRDVAARMLAAMQEARRVAEGHEAVLVSHQLPIWMARRFAEGRKLWHDPRRRECTLASLTSFRFDGATLAGIDYREPAKSLSTRSDPANKGA